MGTPKYDLEEIKAAIRNQSYFLSSRPRSFLKNHYGCVNEIIQELFEEIAKTDFEKSVDLEILPDTIADVYKPTYDDEEWYIKLYQDNDAFVVNIMSCNWSGVTH